MISPPINALASNGKRNFSCITSYLLFGLLHEMSHVAAAAVVLPRLGRAVLGREGLCDATRFVVRALLGRYCLIEVADDAEGLPPDSARHAVRHAGWVFSLALAVSLHNLARARRSAGAGGSVVGGKRGSWLGVDDIIVLAAYATAVEAVATDLLGLVPAFSQAASNHGLGESTLMFFCGNFGIILINPSWINIDGGKTALDMLEKMVEVTMMRGAQSGGVVTFEPAKSGSVANSNAQAPIIRGVRSRVVNAKRTVLSKGLRRKIEKDNCSKLGKNLKGWNDKAFNPNNTGELLARGFYGHTRFATSSKASMGGTHPHQWSPRRLYTIYPFQSAAASNNIKTKNARAPNDDKVMHLAPKSQLMGVENFVTHNGDFEFYKINGKFFDTGAIQSFLSKALRVAMPATVDSAAIAGMMDLLRSQGSFALSARYAVCFEMGGGGTSANPMDPKVEYPSVWHYEEIGEIFRSALDEFVREKGIKSLEDISCSIELRQEVANKVKSDLMDILQQGEKSAFSALASFVSLDTEEGGLGQFVQATIDAFFDNDLLHSMRIFLENAKGSFGLCVTTSLDAHRQVVFAAKGQTVSVAFYPKGIICYGSEQAAVKAGLNYETPQGKTIFGTDFQCVDENAVRLDLDDLGGEICLLDWGYGGDKEPAVSLPNRNLATDKLMGGAVNVVLLHQENAMCKSSKLRERLVELENNAFIKPLLNDCDDPVLADIRDIPRICADIQEDWQDVSLNRMTAWFLGQCVRERMQARVDGSVEPHTNQVDIVVTGCEVSLWVAEQFVADLQKCFPKLGIKAVSSNKLLGLFGQALSMPSIGFPFTHKTLDMKDPIVIIVSHSGGTFGPLACSNLLQSFSSSIFTVTSEWDTQIGKQLRSMYGDKNDLLTSRIFSTEVGVRPAEPCSISVVATHQLLTNIFEHICITIISNPHFRRISGSIITERDLQTLERCNQENIKSLEGIVGSNRQGNEVPKSMKHTEEELRAAGNLWSEHILENVKAYIMSFLYIIVTVTVGFPIISGIAYTAGLRDETSPGDRIFYLTRFLDALIYFWLPQINIFILRLIQGRNMRHRMVGRTVVIGDPCPWVAQSGEAFLSKIFACSYSIAGLNVLSGNPADHLVHRHTHRVVRGSLLVCGRPDGRLTALTTLEASSCLAVNQASSIQSLGGTCESITIGHNMSKLPLSHQGIFLETHRPKFLCEKLLDEADDKEMSELKEKYRRFSRASFVGGSTSFGSFSVVGTQRQTSQDTTSLASFGNKDEKAISDTDWAKNRNSPHMKGPGRSRVAQKIIQSFHSFGQKSGVSESDPNGSTIRSCAGLLGEYSNMEKEARKDTHQLDTIIQDMIQERQEYDVAVKLFHDMDRDNNGTISFKEFVQAFLKMNPNVSITQLQAMFEEADKNGDGALDLKEFIAISRFPHVEVLGKLSVINRDSRGLVQVMPSTEQYFGEELRNTAPNGVGTFLMSQSQHLAMELYESRIASMQRFVAMTVMFHEMGKCVESFFPRISFGLLGYRMDRTHSILRIATTASPVSGADVRDRMLELHLRFKIRKAVNVVARHYQDWKKRREAQIANSANAEAETSDEKLDAGAPARRHTTYPVVQGV